jgi:hypothetical protein
MRYVFAASALLLLSVYYELPAQEDNAQSATLTVSQPDTVFDISFSAEELTVMERDPKLLVEALRNRKAICPGAKLISDCVWQCSDGTYRCTCNERLQRLLTLVAATNEEEGS